MRPHPTRGKLALSLAAGIAVCMSAVGAQAGPPAPYAPQGTPLPDLVVGASRLQSSLRISNKTFSSGSCSVVEGCVVAGTRRVLEFDTQIINQGNADAVLGQPSANPNLYVFSPCHGHYHMLDSLDYSMSFGGLETIGLFDRSNGSFFLRNSNSAGAADLTFNFGGGNLVPVRGDWDNNGTATIGVYNRTTGAFFLRNSNASGAADVTFFFGPAGNNWIPIAGDWDGDGDDTIGLYDPAVGAFYLRNTNSNGPADVTFFFGAGGTLIPVVGDWNSDDFDTIGVYDPSNGTYFLKNSNSNGAADLTFTFGVGGTMQPIVGDWDGSGDDTIGLYDTSSGACFIRNSNSGGTADATFFFGAGGPNMVPITGDWDFDMQGQTLPGIVGLKQAFCWLDSQRVSGSLPSHYNCSNQGITAGWSDVYGRGLDCQWIDITGLAAGNYQLRVSVNDTHTIVTESNYDNNVSSIKVHITSATAPQAPMPQVRITSPRDGTRFKVGEPVTITWEVLQGANATHQEVWFMPTPKAAGPNVDPKHNDPHHDAIARSKIIAEGLGPNVRSITWIPTEEFVMDIGAQIMVRVQDKNNMIGVDQRSEGLITVVK